MVDTYDEYASKEASLKITLVIAEASERIIGFTLHSGSIYKLTSFDVSVIVDVAELGVSLTEVNDLASVVAGTFYNDRVNKVLYLQTAGSVNPDSVFMVLTKKLFFSNMPVNISYDLGTGKDVTWEPFVFSTSKFGVELDNRHQLGVAIEGSGTITMINDQDFWVQNYDNLFFENHRIFVYSWSTELPVTEAKLLFRGRVVSKSYSRDRVAFRVNDLLGELRGDIQLSNIEDIAGSRVPEGLKKAKQRRIYGRVFGHRPTNIDQVLDGYPLTGTVSTTNGNATLSGTSTLFLDEVSPEDELVINGVSVSVESIEGDTSLTLSEEFSGPTVSGVTLQIKPSIPKNYINRIWKVAGHALRQPETTVSNSTSLNRFDIVSDRDLRGGDFVFVGASGTGELVQIDRVSNNHVKLSDTLVGAPANGTSVIRPGVQTVKINDTELRYDRDFTFDASTATLTLKRLAEFNVAPIRSLNGTLTFTSSSRTVTGVDTVFSAQVQPGMYIRPKGTGTFFEIGSVISDTELELKVASTVTDTGAADYKPVINFDPGMDVLSCDALGLTLTGAKDGTFLSKGAQIVKHLIEDAGIEASSIDAASFTLSEDLAEHQLGLVIPSQYTDQKTPKYRDTINRVNKSIFGSLIQNNSFQLQYNILSPKRETTVTQFREFDVIRFTADTSNEKMASEVVIDYQIREYETETGLSFIPAVKNKISNIGKFILKTDRVTTIETLLVDADSAQTFANRWVSILDVGSTVLKISTKLQGIALQVTDRIQLIHSKLYNRRGGGQRKVSGIQSIQKSAVGVDIEAEDLAGAFNSRATITANDAPNFANSSLEQKIILGYITDNVGLINSDRETFNINKIW